MSLEKIVLDAVAENPGLTGVKLASDVISSIFKIRGHFPDDLNSEIEKLVADKKIIEVEYVVPHMDYRAKSLYFPAGTQIKIV